MENLFLTAALLNPNLSVQDSGPLSWAQDDEKKLRAIFAQARRVSAQGCLADAGSIRKGTEDTGLCRIHGRFLVLREADPAKKETVLCTSAKQ